MVERSGRPLRARRRVPTRTERGIIKVRVLRRWGPARIAGFLGLVSSTVHRVLCRYGLARLRHLDRATGRVIRLYERDRPGELVHVDIKKLGTVPEGGGHRIHGRAVGRRNNARSNPVSTHDGTRGYGYMHNAVDDHSRLAYSEILPDETLHTAVAFWRGAQQFFTDSSITVERVLTDNGACYRSRLWRDTLDQDDIKHSRTRPYRPQTNGKVERFNRTALDEWAYAQPYISETERRAALPHFLHQYNYHRHHTSIGGPPASRVHNLTRQNI